MFCKNIQAGRIAIVWQADDVRSVIANKLGAKLESVFLSDAKVDEILHSVLDNHDCSVGVTWDSIAGAIEETLPSFLAQFTYNFHTRATTQLSTNVTIRSPSSSSRSTTSLDGSCPYAGCD